MGKRIGILLGLLAFGGVLAAPAPGGLSPEAQRAAAVIVLMAVWWVTEAVHIAVTSLLPLVLFPALGVLDAVKVAPSYADPNIFLLVGGFMIAMAMQKWGLHRRLALGVIRAVGGGPRRMLGGFLAATAFISMWVSNTATAVMVLPIALAVVSHMPGAAPAKGKPGFAPALMLAVAYASSIGGAATLVGTPPNMIVAGQAKALFPELGEVGFVRWFLFASPIALGMLLFTWGYLAFVMAGHEMPALEADGIRRQLAVLGPWSGPERAVLAIFLLTAVAWVWRADIQLGTAVLPGWTTLAGLKGIHDGTVAIAAAVALFLIPAGKGERLLDWSWAVKLPWDVVLLLGGGFALAESFRVTGLDVWIGQGFSGLGVLPHGLLILILCLVSTFLSEVMSNTAQVSVMMPVLGAAARALGMHPYLLMMPAALSASFSFMMPAGTPPNAIVFGSGHLTVPQMARAGLVLNVLGALWVSLMTGFLAPLVFGARL